MPETTQCSRNVRVPELLLYQTVRNQLGDSPEGRCATLTVDGWSTVGNKPVIEETKISDGARTICACCLNCKEG